MYQAARGLRAPGTWKTAAGSRHGARSNLKVRDLVRARGDIWHGFVTKSKLRHCLIGTRGLNHYSTHNAPQGTCTTRKKPCCAACQDTSPRELEQT